MVGGTTGARGMTILYTALAGFLLFFVTWALFLSVMNVKRHRDTMPTPAKFLSYPLVAIFWPLDFLFNVLVGTVVFLDLPRELLFTSRMGRYLHQPGGWRFDWALWMCGNLLDFADPDGRHCSYRDDGVK